MNKEYEWRLGGALTSIVDWPSPQFVPSIAPFKELYEDMLPLLVKHGFVESWSIGETIEIKLPSVAAVKERYPTVRGENPNVNVMMGVEAFLREHLDVTYEKTKHIDLGSFEKIEYRQCARDMVNQFKVKGLINDFTLGVNRGVTPADPRFFLSKRQLESLDARKIGKGQDLSL
ncbi:hypothetical protein RYA05_05830 [Pseudomonas syringae pv. actinidiae]|nr:hypothetical protein [Pseudomonas syringae pv. actinidiae]